LILEINKQLKRITDQIETEKRIHEVWTRYKDCDMKTQVIHQSIGVIRGLEIAKESLEYILAQEITDQLSIDEYHIADQIDYRGGLVK
jgi:hypothetical protein